MLTIGLDIGGANTKVVALRHPEADGEWGGHGVSVERSEAVYFPFWEGRGEFSSFLQGLCSDLVRDPHRMGVTITAELADCFRTKREGVVDVLGSVKLLDPQAQVLTLRGTFVTLEEAMSAHEEVAAANWTAPAAIAGRVDREAIVIDIGSTTTDITPIIGGSHRLIDPSDRARLEHGNLVYTGALRTNVAAIVDHVMLEGRAVSIATEQFATSADVSLLLGLMEPSDYTVPTSDGGDATQEGARIRLARILCADPSEITLEEAVSVAGWIHRQQITKVARALMSVVARNGFDRDVPCYLAGVGRRSLGQPAAQQAGLTNTHAFHECISRLVACEIAGEQRLTDHAPASSIACLLLPGVRECG